MVIGHRNPDTDSICSAICYANLKQAVTGEEYMPARAGHVNGETQFVLDYFGAEEPQLVEDVRTQVRDIEIRKTKGVADNISLKRAWNIMQENNVVTIPSVREDGTLEGLITVGDITKTYMNIYDSSILSKANTQYSNIIETLEAELIIGSAEAYFDQGKVLIAAANPDLMEFYIEPHDLVILGNRYESQLCAIEMGADCIIVCEGAAVSMTIKKIAQERGCTIIATTYDTYTAARLINQSMPISYFMTREHLITFNSDDYIDEIREVMASKRHRDFPILDKDGYYLGMISRRNLLGAKGKQVILVDHNEKNQAVAGIENAEILEIIDHHRLGTIQTMSPNHRDPSFFIRAVSSVLFFLTAWVLRAVLHAFVSHGFSVVSNHWPFNMPFSFPPRYTKRLMPVPSPGSAFSFTHCQPVSITPFSSK